MIKGMYSRLPHSVKIKNERFIINTDFRIFINFEEKILQGIDKRKACLNTLKRFYPAFSLIIKKGLLKDAIDKFIWFYKCGIINDYKKKSSGSSKKESFRYSYDSLFIWGTYKQLGYDLTKDYIHWWKFKAIWLTIPDNFEFSKIKGYRCYSGDDKNILELKDYYKLPPSRADINDEIRKDKIYEALK